MRGDRRSPARADKKAPARAHKRSQGSGASLSKKSALLEEAITHMNAGRYGRSSSVLKELLTLDPANPEAKRLFATLQLRLGSLVTARNAFQALTDEALERQDYWLAESLLREYLVAGPRCVPFVEKLGSVFELKGDLDAAIEEYAKAVEILVEDPDSEQPDLAAQLVTRITQLSPHNPVLLHLESLLQRANDRPREAVPAEEDGSPPRFAPALSGLDQPATDVEFRIPPADALSDPGRARLPWEDEAEDIQVPQQPTAVQDAAPPTPSWDIAEQPSQTAELGAPPVSPNAEIAATNISLLPDLPVPLPTENSAEAVDAEVVQKGWPTPSIPDSNPAADQGVTAIVQEEAPPAGVNEASGFFLSQSNDGSEQPGRQFEGLPEPTGTVEESPVLHEMGHEEGPDNTELSPVSRQDLTPTGSGLTATEESPTVEIPLRLVSSESDRSIAPVPPPMPWEQVEEIRPESPPVETESRLVAVEVNEDLIAGILQQTDLRERLAGGLTGTTIQEVPGDHLLASEPTAPEPGVALDSQSSVSTNTNSEAETAIFTPPADPLPDVVSPQGVSAAIEPRHAPPASEAVAEGSSSATSADDLLEQPVETMSPEEIAIQSAWTDIDLNLAMPQDTGADLASTAQAESSQFVETHDSGLQKESFPDSSWTLPGSDQTQASGTNPHLSQPDEAIVLHDSGVPAIQESPANIQDLPIRETPLAGEFIAESQIELGSQPVPDLEGDTPGYSEPDIIVEAANSLILDGEGRSAPVDLGARDVGHSDDESSQPGASEHGQSVGLSGRLFEAPAISEELDLESPALAQDRVAPTFAGGKSREDRPTTQFWQEPLVSRSESEEPVSSSASPEIMPHIEKPWPAVSAPVVNASTTSTAAVESAADLTPASKDSRVQIAESRKPISTVGLNESSVRTASRPITAKLSRVLFRIALFIRSCFATAHAVAVTLISLMLFSVGCAILLVGGLGLVWLGLEEKPNSVFQDLMGARPQLTEDPNRNGALYLLGFAAAESKDPIQTGLAIQSERANFSVANGCLTLADPAVPQTGRAATSTLASWYREDIPSGFFGKAATLKERFSGRVVSMARYQKWLTLPFDDVGYGQAANPDCRLILDVHRLFVAEGFAQGLDQGIERIETEVAVWRGLLRKARTLGTKLLAVAAVNDDARVVSGLLTMPELDARYLPRLAKLVSPMDSVEQSLRWPMQHEFLIEKKRIEMALQADHHPTRSWFLAGVALMPLPSQRILNHYADYYEDLIKSNETAQTMPTVPSPYSHVRTPAVRTMDYLMNPVNNILGVPSGPEWEQPISQIRETDALLRLASLQAWIRRGTADVDAKTRVAKAGQNFYDPFTGYPMLINPANNRLYSVGANGKDDDAAPEKDVSVPIPPVGASPSLNAGSTLTPPSR